MANTDYYTTQEDIWKAAGVTIEQIKSDGTILDPNLTHLLLSAHVGNLSALIVKLASEQKTLMSQCDEDFVHTLLQIISVSSGCLVHYLESHSTHLEV